MAAVHDAKRHASRWTRQAVLSVVVLSGAAGPGNSAGALPSAAAWPATSTSNVGVGLCGAPTQAGVDHHYAVSGRLRLLFFWTGRHDVGNARIARNDSPDGSQRLELLIGTDPERAPRQLNRWGYEAETVCGPNAELLGIMTQSDEQEIADATATLGTGTTRSHPYKAVRATRRGSEGSTEVLRLLVDDNLTYRNLDALLERLPPQGSVRHMTVPGATDSGFLVAVAALVHNSVGAPSAANPAVNSPRTFIYAGRLYTLKLGDTRAPKTLLIGTTTYRSAIEGQFEIRNTATGDTTKFQMTYGTTDGLAEVPLRIVYQPRWWLELELTLKD
jgi:hypothetical protein